MERTQNKTIAAPDPERPGYHNFDGQRNPLCPECLCEDQKVRLRFRYTLGIVFCPGGPITIYKGWHCPHCRARLISCNYWQEPELAADGW